MATESTGPFPFEEPVDDDAVRRIMARDIHMIPTGGKVVVDRAILPNSQRGRSLDDVATQIPISPDVVAKPAAQTDIID